MPFFFVYSPFGKHAQLEITAQLPCGYIRSLQDDMIGAEYLYGCGLNRIYRLWRQTVDAIIDLGVFFSIKGVIPMSGNVDFFILPSGRRICYTAVRALNVQDFPTSVAVEVRIYVCVIGVISPIILLPMLLQVIVGTGIRVSAVHADAGGVIEKVRVYMAYIINRICAVLGVELDFAIGTPCQTPFITI